MTLLKHTGAAVAVAIVIGLLTFRLDSYRDYQIAEVAAYVVAVAGLTILIGLSGQISVGNGAFMAVGAYTTALLQLHAGWLDHLHIKGTWQIAAILIASLLVAAVGGAVFGLAAARLRGPYLAGATLMLAVAIPVSVADKYASVFGGDQGLSVAVTTPSALGPTFSPTRWLAWLTCAAALVVLIALANLTTSRVGRSWRALRDDEIAASLAGLNVARLQVLGFAVSAACAGVGGGLLAIVSSIVSPGAYTLTLSIGLLTAAVIGGLGSIVGAVWGSALFVLVPSYLMNVAAGHGGKLFGLSSGSSPFVPIAAYGVVLIAVMLLFPSGIQGGLRRLFGPAVPRAVEPFSLLRRRGPASEHQEEGTI
jgi:branched-chain amino acid transport system permease protein